MQFRIILQFTTIKKQGDLKCAGNITKNAKYKLLTFNPQNN